MSKETDKAVADAIRFHAEALNALFKQAKERNITVSISTSANPYYAQQAGIHPLLTEYSELQEFRFTKTETL